MTQFAMIGLGRMGGNMARRLRRAGIELAAYNRDAAVTERLAADTGARPARSLAELVHQLKPPRCLWLMLPAGSVTEQHLHELVALLARGDVVVDGANGHYRDAVRHAAELEARGLGFVDAGVSGGIWGLDNGYCLMVGGRPEAVRQVEPFLQALAPAPARGWIHCGPPGSGHFTKMVHNGIEYGMMQALAEGLALMQAKTEFKLDLGAITETWRHGSVVRSWLLDLTAQFLAEDASLADIAPLVADSGEGRWTVKEAVDLGVPAPVIAAALSVRFASQGKGDYAAQLLAMMRKAFGGHLVSGKDG